MSSPAVPMDLSQSGAQAPPQQAAAPPAAGPSAPQGPHAGLLRMVQGLALGLDSFAKAAATHGREGGVQEVQQYEGEQQRQQIQAQQAGQQQQRFQTEQQESQQRLQLGNFQVQMAQMQYQHALRLL